MKGVSTVIATILMLVITIALAGTAWAYISGMIPSATAGVEIVDQYCSVGAVAAGTGECPAAGGTCDQVHIVLKNLGNAAIKTSGITFLQTAPTADALTTDGSFGATTSVDPGVTVSWSNTCLGSGPRTCFYRITPPQGKTVSVGIACS
jgi:flagellin-like protein